MSISTNLNTRHNNGDLGEFIEYFAQVCQEIAIFADEIGENHWAKTFFRPAYLALCDDNLTAKQKLNIAIDKTRVFGGMGSWLDCPPHSAYQCGKSENYEQLTDKLWRCRNQAIELIGKIND